MPQYRVRLRSRTDDQWRELLMVAPDESAAREIANRTEREYVEWSLDPRHAAWVPGTVRMDRLNAYGTYADAPATEPASAEDAADEARDLLAALKDTGHEIDATGKAHGPSKIGRAHLHIHHQAAPYEIVTVEAVRPDITRLVTQLQAIYEHDAGAWDDVLKRMRDAGIPTNAVTGSLFGLPARDQISGAGPTIVWTTATSKCSLHSSSYTPAQDTHDFFNDATNELGTGSGYTAGGQTLSTPTAGYDSASDQVRLDAVDTAWTNSTLTARIALVYTDTAGASSTDPTWGWVDFGADVSTVNGTFQISWDAQGIIVYDLT